MAKKYFKNARYKTMHTTIFIFEVYLYSKTYGEKGKQKC